MPDRIMQKRFSFTAIIVLLVVSINPLPPFAHSSDASRTPVLSPGLALSSADPAAIPSSWWREVQQDLRKAEYNLTWQDTTYLPDLAAAYQAPNRANNLRSYFTPQGAIFILREWPGEASTPPWRLGLSLSAWGRSESLAAVLPADLAVEPPDSSASARGGGNWIEYRRGELVERYVNHEQGIEQSFDLSASFAGSGLLQLELAFSGDLQPQVSENGAALTFPGVAGLRLGELEAMDAAGQSLSARYALDGTKLLLVVDDRQARYPLSISQILAVLPSAADWPFYFSISGSSFGASVATAGDVDADGYSDVIIGIPDWDGGINNQGRALLFYGSASGLEGGAGWDKTGGHASDHFGSAVATAGDVDSDGDSEVIVGAYTWGSGGAVFVYPGDPGGLSLTEVVSYTEYLADAHLGSSVAPAGDVNCDGYADIVIGEEWWPYTPTGLPTRYYAGRVLVVYGSATGLGSAYNWIGKSEQADSWLGSSVSTTGDVDGDGCAEIIAGARQLTWGTSLEGGAFVWYGASTAGGGMNEGVAGTLTNADWYTLGGQSNALAGSSVSTAGDVNGDGYADVLVGIPGYTVDQALEGVVKLFLGSSGGLATGYARRLEGNHVAAGLGVAVSTAGDVNGDGYADILAGANGYSHDQNNEGRVELWLGSAAGIQTASDWQYESNIANAYFGSSVATAGDVNGDGYSDIIIGADRWNSSAGAAFAFYGQPGTLETAATWTKDADVPDAHYGASVASAGDVDGDGFADVIVGAPWWDEGEAKEGGAWIYLGSEDGLLGPPDWDKQGNRTNALFGWSVGTAGDVDSDGYDDVIVGGPGYTEAGKADEGWAWVYRGSSAGTLDPPDWQKASAQAGAQFGYSVGTAGDVNGDGYADIIVGAPYWDNPLNNEGGAWVYYGSADGVNTTPGWHVEVDQTNAQYGASVATAGDVNADGYSDVIVGAPCWTNSLTCEGGAWVYPGTMAGLSQSAIWAQEGNRTDATFGAAVASAGDVDGDSYADVIIGAPRWSNTQAQEGKAFLYPGYNQGVDDYLYWYKEADMTGAYYGTSVGTAGDVNGDGYADIIVGSPGYTSSETDEGGAWVYLGAASGTHFVPDWHVYGGQEGAGMGSAVATAGDVNGDGYAEVVVGAPYYETSAPEEDEGQAFVYYGNASLGVALKMVQYHVGGGVLAHLGKLHSTRLGVSVKRPSPFGKGEKKVEMELLPLRWEFDGHDAYLTSSWSNSSSSLNISSGILAIDNPYHWRLRLVYNPATTPFMPASRWFTVPWNGWNESRLSQPGDADVFAAGQQVAISSSYAGTTRSAF